MRRLRQLKKGLIFLLAFIFDQYQEISIKNYYRAFYLPGYFGKRQSLYHLLTRTVKIGEIEKVVKNGEVYLKLTSKGGKFFDEKISLWELSQREWDKIWRVVIFDIKEENRQTRDTFRKKLKEWGFALWQKSVYLSPHPIFPEIDEFLKEKNLFPKVICMEAKTLGIKNHDRFAWIVFNLKKLEEEYLRLEKKVDNLIKVKKNTQSQIREVINKFQSLILKDPFLPKGLIKKSWPRDRIKEKIRRLLLRF